MHTPLCNNGENPCVKCQAEADKEEKNLEKSDEKICSICFGTYVGFGNNAAPVNNGRCCGECNATVVIPARIKRMHNEYAASREREKNLARRVVLAQNDLIDKAFSTFK